MTVTINATSITVTATARTSGPERLTHPMSDDFRVVHRRQHRTGEEHGHDSHQHDPKVASPGQGQCHHREQRHDDCP